MIALDTNVLVRFLTQDDPEQGRRATAVIAGCTAAEPGFIAREVMVELVWVLERAYRLPRAEIARAVEGLLESEDLAVEAAERVGLAVHRYRTQGQGFSDMMIALAAEDAGCAALLTFDRRLARFESVRMVD